MTVAAQGQRSGGYLERPAPSSLADVIDSILDKGMVIDAYVRVSLVGIELLTIDARIVVASVDTYLRFAEATNRLDLYEKGGKDLPGVIEEMQDSGSRGRTRGILGGAKEALLGSGDEDEDQGEEAEEAEEERRPRRRPARQSTARRRRSES
jgi:hypothetical protein